MFSCSTDQQNGVYGNSLCSSVAFWYDFNSDDWTITQLGHGEESTLSGFTYIHTQYV